MVLQLKGSSKGAGYNDGNDPTIGAADVGVDAIGPHGTADCVYALSSFIKRQGFQVRCHEVPAAQMAIQTIPSPAASTAATYPGPHGAGYAGRESFKAPRLFPDLKARWLTAGGVPKPAAVPIPESTAPAPLAPEMGGPSASSAASSEVKLPETAKQAIGHVGGPHAKAAAQSPTPAGAYPAPMQALSAPHSPTHPQHCSFAIVTPPKPGKFDARAAIRAGVPKGAAFGKLARGEAVEVDAPGGSGAKVVVRPQDVIGPSQPGSCVLFLRCGGEEDGSFSESKEDPERAPSAAAATDVDADAGYMVGVKGAHSLTRRIKTWARQSYWSCWKESAATGSPVAVPQTGLTVGAGTDQAGADPAQAQAAAGSSRTAEASPAWQARLVAVVHLDPVEIVSRPEYVAFARSLAAPWQSAPAQQPPMESESESASGAGAAGDSHLPSRRDGVLHMFAHPSCMSARRRRLGCARVLPGSVSAQLIAHHVLCPAAFPLPRILRSAARPESASSSSDSSGLPFDSDAAAAIHACLSAAAKGEVVRQDPEEAGLATRMLEIGLPSGAVAAESYASVDLRAGASSLEQRLVRIPSKSTGWSGALAVGSVRYPWPASKAVLQAALDSLRAASGAPAHVHNPLERHCDNVAKAAIAALQESASHDKEQVAVVDAPSVAARAGQAYKEMELVERTTAAWAAEGALFTTPPGMSTNPTLLPFAPASRPAGMDAATVGPDGEMPADACLLFLGTSSAVPSKYRNVTSMLLVPSASARVVLLDCGEGTLEQLEAMLGHESEKQDLSETSADEYGRSSGAEPLMDEGRPDHLPADATGAPFHASLPATVEDVLRRLGIVWLSHHHADHHAGITAVLEQRAILAAREIDARTTDLARAPERASTSSSPTRAWYEDPVLVVAPKNSARYIRKWAARIDRLYSAAVKRHQMSSEHPGGLPERSFVLVDETVLRAPWAMQFTDNHPMVAVKGPVGAQEQAAGIAEEEEVFGDGGTATPATGEHVSSTAPPAASASTEATGLDDRVALNSSPAGVSSAKTAPSVSIASKAGNWVAPAFSAGSFVDATEYARAVGSGGLPSSISREEMMRLATTNLRASDASGKVVDEAPSASKETDQAAEGEDTAAVVARALATVGAFRATSCPVWHCHNAFAVRFDFYCEPAPTSSSSSSASSPEVISRREWSFVFAGDSRPCDSEVRLSLGASLLVHEATFEDGLEALAAEKRHSTVSQALFVAAACRARAVALQHFSARQPKLPVLWTGGIESAARGPAVAASATAGVGYGASALGGASPAAATAPSAWPWQWDRRAGPPPSRVALCYDFMVLAGDGPPALPGFDLSTAAGPRIVSKVLPALHALHLGEDDAGSVGSMEDAGPYDGAAPGKGAKQGKGGQGKGKGKGKGAGKQQGSKKKGDRAAKKKQQQQLHYSKGGGKREPTRAPESKESSKVSSSLAAYGSGDTIGRATPADDSVGIGGKRASSGGSCGASDQQPASAGLLAEGCGVQDGVGGGYTKPSEPAGVGPASSAAGAGERPTKVRRVEGGESSASSV